VTILNPRNTKFGLGDIDFSFLKMRYQCLSGGEHIYIWIFLPPLGGSLSLSFKDGMGNVLGTLNPGWWFSKKRISFDSMVLKTIKELMKEPVVLCQFH
jgi:hypothetical protein